MIDSNVFSANELLSSNPVATFSAIFEIRRVSAIVVRGDQRAALTKNNYFRCLQKN
jgi:hypothetical protein